MAGFGYTETAPGKTAGSRRRFVHPDREPIILHKPHPGNELKAYQVTQIVAYLKEEGLA
ncbi:MAG: type II toxin-antitoxin system HicA family toxin [Acidobacteriaceae bacterium]|nr:type II toxin-antitoxin system HicA family toxin [Acidobacteriaceae bacterium]